MSRLRNIAEIFHFLKARNKAWLWVVVLALLFMAGFITLSQTILPFIYTLF